MVDLRFSNSVQIMLSLANAARKGEELTTSAQLAVGLGTNPALIRKLLAALSQAGLIKTYKGKSGGARLEKNPKQITLRQIYEVVVDSDIVCGPEEYNAKCAVGACMSKVFSAVANGMENASLKYLEGINLQQLLAQVK